MSNDVNLTNYKNSFVQVIIPANMAECPTHGQVGTWVRMNSGKGELLCVICKAVIFEWIIEEKASTDE